MGYLETLELKTPKGIQVSDHLSMDAIIFFDPAVINNDTNRKVNAPFKIPNDAFTSQNPFNVPLS